MNTETNELRYKNFSIRARPRSIPEKQEWTLRCGIYEHFGSGVRSRGFYDQNGDQYKTEKEAIKGCFAFGKKIIDEKFS